ncbi:MAG: homoserine O-acetyltransferase [Candidatus Omnitrophica bacterium]|nr:MAG: Homoserine O-acetyltransferase [Candidatus Hinthialibacteria bacterium OLB16]MBW7939415.1 homoserine O-acetyltransferase [Candidatus Omnitrophota bacterium]MCC6732767.1 homoserine O-acetyltransferase [Candidatus Omnitrophota bacterium]MCK6494961.1 homoserine O-acetyltransferase [bacterium]MCL4735809.1 homoserine O-acetyltransferase [Candidatus Omnitrophota bacterium]
MSDPANALLEARKKNYDLPESPRSVGWTHIQRATVADRENPFVLETGKTLWPVEVEYETYGRLNRTRDNAIMVFHALSGDAHVAGWDADAEKMGRTWRLARPGWWDDFIGPGKPLDTGRYFIICANVLGSCYGTTGPTSMCPSAGEPYRMSFPAVSVGDWVRLHGRLLDHLGIDTLLAAIGGSLGGQQALEFSLSMPERVRGAIILAASPWLSAQGLAFNAVARHVIMTDPHWNNGNYSSDKGPEHGLSAARMIGHITYLSRMSMENKFGRRRGRTPSNDRSEGWIVNENGNGNSNGAFEEDPFFEVESYLRYQGSRFVQRFDANSYLYILRAMDHYDASTWGHGDLIEAARRVKCNNLIISFTSDWLYPPGSCRDWATALSRLGRSVTYVNIPSSYGHDAFLLEVEQEGNLVRSFIHQLEKID